MEEEQKLFDELVHKGCCPRCTLRYLGLCKTLLTFECPETCLANFGFIEPTEEPKTKIRKDCPCSVCLGLLHDQTIDKMVEHEDLIKVQEYQSETFVAYITFPTCILIRDHSMKIHLKKNFPESFDASKAIKVNNAWNYSIKERLCKKFNKTYDRFSKFTVHFYTDYSLEEEELSPVRNRVNQNLSKHTVNSMLESIPDEIFEKLIKVPPSSPLYEIEVKNVKCYSEPIYLIGNYCKYSRKLPQAPNAFCDEPAKTTIETILMDALRNVLRDYKEAMFKASSFDDANIRVLGKGRSFFLHITDPKFDTITREDCAKIEKQIKETQVMEVKNLRVSDRRDTKVVLDSERVATRLYKVLCLVRQCKNVNYCVNAVNMLRTVTVRQKTPIRVIQRDIATKTKKIFYIRATKVEDKQNLIELEVCTDCAFHIPEFVHGDFGRTVPSLSEIMKAKVECLAVDIVDFSPTLPCLAEPEDVLPTLKQDVA